MGASVLGKDLEDDLGAVEHTRLDRQLEVALLPRAEVFVADHDVEAALELHIAQRLDLAHSDEVCGVDHGPPLHVGSDDVCARGAGEVRQLVHLLANRLRFGAR